MDDNNFQNSLCITSMKQKLSGPTEAHGPFIIIHQSINLSDYFHYAPGDGSPHGGILLLLCPYVCMYVRACLKFWLK